ncbi:hypothetical protein LTR16_006736, partial [Cryomyces antarcticus]
RLHKLMTLKKLEEKQEEHDSIGTDEEDGYVESQLVEGIEDLKSKRSVLSCAFPLGKRAP